MTTDNFDIKDSGERAEFASGMVRDVQKGKPRFDLLHPKGVPFKDQLLTRVATHMGRAAEGKYGERNWEQAEGEAELDRFRGSAERHLEQWIAGERDEDHAAAVIFNLLGGELVHWKMDQAAKKADGLSRTYFLPNAVMDRIFKQDEAFKMTAHAAPFSRDSLDLLAGVPIFPISSAVSKLFHADPKKGWDKRLMEEVREDADATDFATLEDLAETRLEDAAQQDALDRVDIDAEQESKGEQSVMSAVWEKTEARHDVRERLIQRRIQERKNDLGYLADEARDSGVYDIAAELEKKAAKVDAFIKQERENEMLAAISKKNRERMDDDCSAALHEVFAEDKPLGPIVIETRQDPTDEQRERLISEFLVDESAADGVEVTDETTAREWAAKLIDMGWSKTLPFDI